MKDNDSAGAVAEWDIANANNDSGASSNNRQLKRIIIVCGHWLLGTDLCALSTCPGVGRNPTMAKSLRKSKPLIDDGDTELDNRARE